MRSFMETSLACSVSCCPGCRCSSCGPHFAGRIRRARLGESRIELDRFPMFTGGVNSGRLLVKNDVASPSSWKFTLECEVTRGSGEDSYKTTIFEAAVAHEGSEPGEGWGRTTVPFEFQIPSNAQATDIEDSRVAWKLAVAGTTEDARYEAEFEVPVFETERQQSEIHDVL